MKLFCLQEKLIMLNEVSQPHKDKELMFSLICGFGCRGEDIKVKEGLSGMWEGKSGSREGNKKGQEMEI
jgi:hypothetical protein